MDTLLNGWAIAGCLGYAFFTAPTLFGALSRRRLYGALRAAGILCLACSAYLVACGGYIASSWTNPFAGQGDRLAGAVHNHGHGSSSGSSSCGPRSSSWSVRPWATSVSWS